MSIDKNTAQRVMVTICTEVLASLWRFLQLLSAEDVFGVHHRLVKHALRLVQAGFFIPLVEKEML